jgi:hypothetical protein
MPESHEPGSSTTSPDGGGVHGGCTVGAMTEPADEARVDSRADLLPEEVTAGSDDPHDQAEAILEESDERTEDPEGTRHESTQTPG